MIDKKREIFIRLQHIEKVVEVLSKIKSEQDQLKKFFDMYDQLAFAEDKVFENWSSYLEDINQKVDHVNL
jgi:hypothetical protein